MFDRRVFIRSFAAVVGAAIAAGPRPLLVDCEPPILGLAEPQWIWGPRLTKFVPVQDEVAWVAYLTAQRSDGVNFFVIVPASVEEWDSLGTGARRRKYLEHQVEKGLLTLDQYRTCACKPGVPCLLHEPLPLES